MPPRYAYWTILIDNAPTAFRAKDQEDLLPTLQQLRRTNQNVALKWFAHGRIWDSPELARARPPREDDGVKRDRDWRPGGQHKDPRARFDKNAKKKRPAPDGAGHRTHGEGARPDRPRDDRPRDQRRPDDRSQGEASRGDRNAFVKPRHDAPRADRPRFDRPRDDRPRQDRPHFDRPRDDRPRRDQPRVDGPRDQRGRSDRPPSERPHGTPYGKPQPPQRPWQDRPRPPHAGGGGGQRDMRGSGHDTGRRPHPGGDRSRTPGAGQQRPWQSKPPGRPRENDRPDRPWQGRSKPPAGDRDRAPSADRRPPADRRPTEKRPYAPHTDRPRDNWRGKPSGPRSDWKGKPAPRAGRPPARFDNPADERPRKPKGPKGPGGSESE